VPGLAQHRLPFNEALRGAATGKLNDRGEC
jgi:hypothetical protein